MTEVEKMRSTQLADMAAPELQVRFEHAKKLLARMRGMSTYDAGYRELLEELVPEIPETSIICPPFHCDHGDGIKLGEHVFVNANCTFLDGKYHSIRRGNVSCSSNLKLMSGCKITRVGHEQKL